MLEIDIFRNLYFQKFLGVLRGYTLSWVLYWGGKNFYFYYMLEIDIFRNLYFQKFLGVLRGDFKGVSGCPNDTQMPYWLRLWQAGDIPKIPIIVTSLWWHMTTTQQTVSHKRIVYKYSLFVAPTEGRTEGGRGIKWPLRPLTTSSTMISVRPDICPKCDQCGQTMVTAAL